MSLRKFNQRKNLLNYSEDFGHLTWSKVSINVTSNSLIAPDGTLTASTITTVDNAHALVQAYKDTVFPGEKYTLSFWAKKGTLSHYNYSVYDISNGSSIIIPTSYTARISETSWSKVSCIFTIPAGCKKIQVYPLRDSDAIGTVYIWGTQLERGIVPTEYQKTIDGPTNISLSINSPLRQL